MTILLEQQARQGTHFSASIQSPPGITGVQVTCDIHPDDLAAQGLTLTIIVEYSADGGKNWVFWRSATWNSPADTEESPGIGFGPSIPGNRLRVRLDIPVSMRVGAQIEYSF